MKEIGKLLVSCLTALGVMFSSFAGTAVSVWALDIPATVVDSGDCGASVTWSLDDSGVLTISGSGEMDSYNSNRVGDVIDGSTAPWNGHKDSITSVVIEGSVTNVGNYAFFRYEQIQEVTLAESVTKIGHSSFYGCKGLKSIEIPSGVTEIGEYAFCDTGLTEFPVLPSGVTVIEADTFRLFYIEGDIHIPKTVSEIKTYAFFMSGAKNFYCYKGTEVNSYPRAQIFILDDDNADGSLNVSEVHLIDQQKSVTVTDDMNISFVAEGERSKVSKVGHTHEYNAGACVICGLSTHSPSGSCGASADDSVSWALEDGVLTIGGSGAMANYSVSSNTPWYGYKGDITSVVVENGVTRIGSHAFGECSSIVSVDMADSVTMIYDYAFSGCASLAAIDIPRNVSFIGEGAFQNSGLKEMPKLPSGMNGIDNYVFKGCSGITGDIIIEDNIQSIGPGAFSGCSGIDNVYYSTQIINWGDIFDISCSILEYDDDECITSITLGKGKTSVTITDDILENFYELSVAKSERSKVSKEGHEHRYEEVSSVDNECSICGDQAPFGYCGAAGNKVNVMWQIYEGMLAIQGNGAMADYTASDPAPWDKFADDITSIYVVGVDNIGSRAFAGIELGGDIVIPDSVTTIGEGAFKGTDITSVTLLGSSVDVGAEAFDGCQKLGPVIYAGAITNKDNSFPEGTAKMQLAVSDGGLTVTIADDGGKSAIKVPDTIGENYLENPSVVKIDKGSFTGKIIHTHTDDGSGNCTVCGGKSDECVLVLNPEKMTIEVGETKTIEAVLYNAGDYTLTNASSDKPDIAVVDALDSVNRIVYVKGIGKGSATITVVADDITAECVVTVVEKSETPPEDGTVVLWQGSKDLGTDWSANVQIEAAKFADVEAGHTIKISFTNAGEDTQLKISSMTEGWPPLTSPEPDAEWGTVKVTDSPFSFVLNADDAAALKEFGMAISGARATITKVELVAHTHTFSEAWTKDETHHWHAATCEHTDEVSGKAEHSFANGVCEVCGYSKDVLSGDCGENVQWSLKNGVLTISGNGAMDSFSVTANISHTPWKNYRDSITKAVIEDGVTNVGDNAFFGYEQLKTVEIAESVVKIGYSAFMFCDNLTSVKIPSRVTEIGSRAFEYSGLTELPELPSGINIIEDYTFAHTAISGDITLPANIKEIKHGVFYGTDVTSVTLLGSNVEIDQEAFADCEKLEAVIYTAINAQDNSFPAGTAQLKFEPAGKGLTVTIVDDGGRDAIKVPDEINGKPVSKIDKGGFDVKILHNHKFENGVCTVCGEGTQTPALKPTLALEPAELTLKVGESKEIAIIAENAEGYSFTAEVNLTSVLRVDNSSDGKVTVTGVKEGEATVRVTGTKDGAESIAADCVVTVAKSHEHAPAEAWTYNAEGHWHACAGCDEKTDYRAHELVEGVCAVCGYSNIVDPKVSVVIDPASAALHAGDTLAITAAASKNGFAVEDAVFAWSSDNEKIVKVNSRGEATAVGIGTAKVTAEYCGVKASCTITVEARPVLTLTPASLSLKKGAEKTLKIKVTVGGKVVEDPSVEWSSSNESVATVDGGKVTALKAGKAVITAEYDGVKAACSVTVGSTGSSSANRPRPSRPSYDDDSSGSTGSTGTTSVPKLNGASRNWSDISKEIATGGGSYTIDLNGEKEIPADVVRAISQSGKTVQAVVDPSVTLEINGAEVNSNLPIAFAKTEVTPENLRGTNGLGFSYAGAANTGVSVKFRQTNAGRFANLYLKSGNSYSFANNAKVAADGSVKLSVPSSGVFVIMLSEFSDLRGDADNSGALNALDAALILKNTAEGKKPSNFPAADYDGNGVCNALDAAFILKQIIR